MGLFGIGKKSKIAKSFNGKCVNYVTRRVEDENGVRDEIVGKSGRIAVVDGFIKVICETEDVFRCREDQAKVNVLLSGNGAVVEGENSVIGSKDKIIVYYSKLK